MLLESQNELMAAEETLNVNLPQVTKLTNANADDDDIEIDDMVLELFSRLHENDPPDTNAIGDICNASDYALAEVSVQLNRIDFPSFTINNLQAVLQENGIIENGNGNGAATRKCPKRTNAVNSEVKADGDSVGDAKYSKHEPRRKRNTKEFNESHCAIKIATQEIFKDPAASNDVGNGNDIVRIELSFVDKTTATVQMDSTPTMQAKNSTTTAARVYICDVCHKNFPVAGRFLAHFRRVHLKSLYKKQAKCPYCPRYFTTIGKFISIYS